MILGEKNADEIGACLLLEMWDTLPDTEGRGPGTGWVSFAAGIKLITHGARRYDPWPYDGLALDMALKSQIQSQFVVPSYVRVGPSYPRIGPSCSRG